MKWQSHKVAIHLSKLLGYLSILVLLLATAFAGVVNDVSGLNPIIVAEVKAPTSISEIQKIVKNHPGPISIGGGRYSMGGQIATEQTLFIDMRQLNKIVAFSKETKTITVQAGCTWRDIQKVIDPYDLSVKVMQTYNNFTVGGSLSVNAHGRYMGEGPLIESVEAIKIVLANGDLIEATPTKNQKIFYGAIGGYGGLGVIVEATLKLTDNDNIEQQTKLMPLSDYKKYFLNTIRDNKQAIFHNGDIYPPDFETVNAITWFKTEKPLTIQDRFKPLQENYLFRKIILYWITELPFGHWVREHIIDPCIYYNNPVVKRNYEASYDVQELEPKTRDKSTYALQEYFIPIRNFDSFASKISSILRKYDVNVVNISIRHAKKDPGSLMAWAREEVFSFVLYYKQRTTPEDKEKVGIWTRELIEAALSSEGAYYLPYQLQATKDQFLRAYPHAPLFFELKKELDPTYKFRNKLWDKYYG